MFHSQFSFFSQWKSMRKFATLWVLLLIQNWHSSDRSLVNKMFLKTWGTLFCPAFRNAQTMSVTPSNSSKQPGEQRNSCGITSSTFHPPQWSWDAEHSSMFLSLKQSTEFEGTRLSRAWENNVTAHTAPKMRMDFFSKMWKMASSLKRTNSSWRTQMHWGKNFV